MSKYKTLDDALRDLKKTFVYDEFDSDWRIENLDGSGFRWGNEQEEVSREKAEKRALDSLNDYKMFLDNPMTQEQKEAADRVIEGLSCDGIEKFDAFFDGDEAKNLCKVFNKANQYQYRHIHLYLYRAGVDALFEIMYSYHGSAKSH